MSYRLGCIILAAGNSERYGSNKFVSAHPSGQSLLGYVVRQYQSLSPLPVMVVSGGWHDAIRDLFFDTGQVTVQRNSNWQDGMSTSIHAGVNAFRNQHPDTTHLLIGLGDQAGVSERSLQPLVARSFLEQRRVIASQWGNNMGAPAVFPAPVWETLLTLSGDKGAHGLLQEWAARDKPLCLPVGHPEAAWDIDSPGDWAHSIP